MNTAQNNDMTPFVDLLAEIGDGKEVVEIGTRTGNSAAAFLRTCKALTTIDIVPCSLPAAVREDPRLTVVVDNSQIMEPVHGDVLLVDGDHSFQGVYGDLSRWHVVIDERIAVHDTACHKWPGVRKALNAFLSMSDQWMVEHDMQDYPGMVILKRAESKQA